MKVVQLSQDEKVIGICALCAEYIPTRGSVCFEDKEKDKVICLHCVKSICRMYLADCLSVELEIK